MPYLLTALCAITCAIQSPIMKLYQKKRSSGIYLFSSLTAATASLFFLFSGLFSGGLHYNGKVLLYALAFSVSAAVCNVTMQMALGCGSLALTSLFSAYSLMLPTLYGILFLGERLGTLAYIGIALLAISLYLTNASFGHKDEEKEKEKFNAKWLLLALAAAVTNGLCSIIQKEQQLAFEGAYKNEMMSAAFGFSALLLIPLIVAKERTEIKGILRDATIPAVGRGIANGATNLLVMVVTATIATSIFFPIISGGSMVIAYALSILLFKERFTPYQHAGIGVGVLSIILLNI